MKYLILAISLILWGCAGSSSPVLRSGFYNEPSQVPDCTAKLNGYSADVMSAKELWTCRNLNWEKEPWR